MHWCHNETLMVILAIGPLPVTMFLMACAKKWWPKWSDYREKGGFLVMSDKVDTLAARFLVITLSTFVVFILAYSLIGGDEARTVLLKGRSCADSTTHDKTDQERSTDPR